MQAAFFPTVSVVVGATDVPINLLAPMPEITAALLPQTIKCCSWLVIYGHYPVNVTHLMGHPQFAGPNHASQAYASPDGFDGWQGVNKEGLCFTGWFNWCGKRSGGSVGHWRTSVLDMCGVTTAVVAVTRGMWGLEKEWCKCLCKARVFSC